MFGVLGGLAAFGLIGLFAGPVVILAVLLAVWREWLERQAEQPVGHRRRSGGDTCRASHR
ncbi:hypothetical protein N234_34680 [Ralstonia pickettii DTP0602]|nr:hypothetical protein N234_34680 [Ralstonia pickettii DTP0602]